MQKEKTLGTAAAKAGMDEKTARKYRDAGKLPSQMKKPRIWRTRSDPFAEVWSDVESILTTDPSVEAKTIFDHLGRTQEGRFQEGQLRTLQRQIKIWRAQKGEPKEVIFAQSYQPGEQCQSDFTHCKALEVTIQRQPFPHLLYHFVLAYSNWEHATICFSESFEGLLSGLQNALWELGAVPEEHRTDSLSTAINNLKDPKEFTERYQALLNHYGLRASHSQAGRAHEIGDIEQAHHRLKQALGQELILRGSCNFESRAAYESFLRRMLKRRNAARQVRLKEELEVMRRLPARCLEDYTVEKVPVSRHSTIRVRHNTYSVDSRLIRETVEVRLHIDRLEVFYAGQRVDELPRLRGDGKHCIQYRHVIDSLVRKPGAFGHYRYQSDLFPRLRFRVAYDELRRYYPATADRQYLKILELAAKVNEERVDEALNHLIETGQTITAEAVRELVLNEKLFEPSWPLEVDAVEVAVYDRLLQGEEEEGAWRA